MISVRDLRVGDVVLHPGYTFPVRLMAHQAREFGVFVLAFADVDASRNVRIEHGYAGDWLFEQIGELPAMPIEQMLPSASSPDDTDDVLATNVAIG